MRSHVTTLFVMVYIALMLYPLSANAKVIYVDQSATGNNDGTTWANARTDLTNALSQAVANDIIKVARGLYKPTTGTDRTISFNLKSGVSLYGGYAGTSNAQPSLRDVDLYETVLSGDIGTIGDNSDNSYTIVNTSSTDNTTIIDGFTITAGNANDNTGGGSITSSTAGAGIFNQQGNPSIRHCTFKDNHAYSAGAGLTNYQNANPTVINCKFTNNTLTNGSGAAILNYQANSLITNSTFVGNTATSSAGAVYNIFASPTIINCKFMGNTALSGGAMYNLYDNAAGKLINCVFSGNHANINQGYGGAIVFQLSNTTIRNCSFTNNQAFQGGALVVAYSQTQIVHLYNCILWNNTAGEIIALNASLPQVTYSNIKGGFLGLGNINADPLFIDADGPDNIPGTADDNLHLQPASPCIDAGNNIGVGTDVFDINNDGNLAELIPLDCDLNPRFLDNPWKTNTGSTAGTTLEMIDIGAYEWHHRADIYVDKKVDMLDFARFASWWHNSPCTYCDGADINADGTVDITDLALLSQSWLLNY